MQKNFHLNAIIISILITLLCTSCAFNKLFYQATRLPAGTKQITFKSASDSVTVHFVGNNHQPVFVKNSNDTIHFGYTIESVLFCSTNGDTLNGWWLQPDKQPILGTILHLHGNGGCLASQFKAIAPLAEKGFQIFMFDYSGYGFSEGKANRKTVLENALSALDYVQSKTSVKDLKLIIYGQSLGGHLASVVASERQNDINGLVIEGAFSSHKDIANHMVPVLGKLFVKNGYSAYKSIRAFHKPLLVIHSTEDAVVPFNLGKKIFNNANEPKQFFEVRKCHICAPNYYPEEITAKIKAFILK
jgi:hypothetical protein